MTDAQVIKKIKELKEIKPRKDWVVLAKTQILGSPTTSGEASFWTIFSPEKWWGVRFQYKQAFATVTIFVVLVGLFGFSQHSLPGDFLYTVKKVSEKGQMALVSEQNLPKAQLDLANRRLEELGRIAKSNQVRKLAPAIEEFQADILQAAKNLAKLDKVDQEIIEKTREIKENKEKIEEILATKIETEELDNALAQLIEREIADLENRSLSEKQKELLEKAKLYYNEGNYQEALVTILGLSQMLY